MSPNQSQPGESRLIHLLAQSLQDSRSSEEALQRWSARYLSEFGLPSRIPREDWPKILELVDDLDLEAERPEEIARLRWESFYRWLLRTSRPDGSPMWGDPGRDPDRKRLLLKWARWLNDPSARRVLSWWYPREAGPKDSEEPPFLPAAADPQTGLAVLRANWLTSGDWLAVDPGESGSGFGLELGVRGRAWLGPSWSLETDQSLTRARLTHWSSNWRADVAEWTFLLGAVRIARTAVLARDQGLAVLGEEVDSREPWTTRTGFTLAPDLTVHLEAGSPSVKLTAARRGTVWLHALTIMASGSRDLSSPSPTWQLDGNQLWLSAPPRSSTSRRSWSAVLVSWDASRVRKPLQCRPLTVSRLARIMDSDMAFAVRLAWGRDDQWLLYRSLGQDRGLRAVLGHQTNARFLLAKFNLEGRVTPVASIDPTTP